MNEFECAIVHPSVRGNRLILTEAREKRLVRLLRARLKYTSYAKVRSLPWVDVGVFKMNFRRMAIEEWFDKYQYEIDYDIGESGVKFFDLKTLGMDLANIQLRYGYHKGNPKLRELISEQYDGLSSENIAVTTGASEANFAVIASIIDSHDHMIIEHPNYPSNYEVPTSLNMNFDFLKLKFEEKFRPNTGRLESLLRKNTKLVSLTNPNNPTGSTLTEEELLKLIDLAESNNFYLLLDETYHELYFGKPPPPAASLSSKAISISSMSKAYGLPGIRIGWVAADKSIIDAVCAVREQLTISNSSLGEAVAEAVLKRKDDLLKEIKVRVRSNLTILEEWFSKQKNLDWIPPSGGVVCFPRFRTSTKNLCRILVEKYRTFVVPGYCFGLDEFFRLGFGGNREELIKGLKCVDSVIREITE